MVNLLLSPEKYLARSMSSRPSMIQLAEQVGMLSVAEKYIRDLNADAQPKLFGQDWNDEAWAVCKSDMLIKGEDADNIIMGTPLLKTASTACRWQEMDVRFHAVQSSVRCRMEATAEVLRE